MRNLVLGKCPFWWSLPCVLKMSKMSSGSQCSANGIVNAAVIWYVIQRAWSLVLVWTSGLNSSPKCHSPFAFTDQTEPRRWLVSRASCDMTCGCFSERAIDRFFSVLWVGAYEGVLAEIMKDSWLRDRFMVRETVRNIMMSVMSKHEGWKEMQFDWKGLYNVNKKMFDWN